MRGLLGHLRLRVPPTREAADQSMGGQAALSTLGVVVQGVVRFVYSVLVGNTFGKLVLGAVNSGISLALFASLLVPSATAMAASKHVARARGAGDLEEGDRVAGYLGRLTLLAMAVLGVGAAVLAPPLLGLGVLESVLTGALAVTYSGYVFVRGFLFGAGQVVRATVWDVLSSVLALAGLAAVVLADTTAWLLLPLVLGYGAYCAVSWPRGRSGGVAPELRREIRGFVVLTLVNSVATGGFLQLTMVAAQFWDRTNAGSFAAALSLATPASLVSRSLTLVLFPSLSAAHGRGDLVGARQRTDVATRGLAVLSLATFGPLMLVSPLLIDLFYRRGGFDEAKLLLPVLLAAVLVTNVAAGAINSLLSREHRYSRIVVTASIVGAVVGMTWWALRAPEAGVAQVATGFLVGSAVVGLWPVVAVWVLDRHVWSALAVRFLVGCGVLAAAVWWQQSTNMSGLAQVGTAVAFVALWLAVSAGDVRRLAGAARR